MNLKGLRIPAMPLLRSTLAVLIRAIASLDALRPVLLLLLVFCSSFLNGCGNNGQDAPEHTISRAVSAPAHEEKHPTPTTTADHKQELPQIKVMPDVAVLPIEHELSPEAQGLFAYLQAVRAILDEDEAGLLESALIASSLVPSKDPINAQTDISPKKTTASDEKSFIQDTASPEFFEPDAALTSSLQTNSYTWPTQIWLDGGVWLMSRKSPNAIPYLEQALKSQPEDISLNLLLAEALGEHGMAQRGAELMRNYLVRHPDMLDARLELALLLVKERKFDEAEKLLTEIPAKQRTPLVDYYHAKALAGMGRKTEAIAFLRRSVRGLPDFMEALTELAYLLEQEGELREARTTYEKLAKLQFSPQDVYLRLVHLSLSLKQPEKALQYISQGPDTIPFKLTAVSMLMDARHYLQAERLLKQLSSRDGAPDDVYLLLADLAYEQRRDLNMALAWLNKIPPASPVAPRARLLHVQLLAEAGKMEDALKLVRESCKEFPLSPELRSMEIRILGRQKQMDAALVAAQSAASEWPDNMDIAFLLGSLLDENGKKKEALSVMEGILKKQPDNFQALNYVGYTLADENRELERALQLLTKADALAPNQSYIIDSLAWALFRAGKAEEALSKIRYAVSLDGPVDATIWEHYGDIAKYLGHGNEARRAYQKALDLKPANAETLRQRLAQP